MSRYGDFRCLDCGRHTGDLREYYVVRPEVWAAAFPPGTVDTSGMLCVACLEARLGRELAPADFLPCAANVIFAVSPLLASRQGWVRSVLNNRNARLERAAGPTRSTGAPPMEKDTP